MDVCEEQVFTILSVFHQNNKKMLQASLVKNGLYPKINCIDVLYTVTVLKC